VPRNTTLSSWVRCQRKYKKMKDGGKATPLTEERIRLLVEIGLDWAPMKGDGHSKMLSQRQISTSMKVWMKHYK